MTTSAIVLCGGGSTRMGRDKASLPFGDETMLGRVIRLVGELAHEVVVVAREGQELPAGLDKPSAFAPSASADKKGWSLRVVRDPVEGLGPLAGIVTGLQAITGDRAFVTACDMPLLRPALMRRLIDLAGEHDVCVPVSDGHVMTMCAVYRASVIDEAERRIASGELSVRGLIDRMDVKKVDAAELRDVDPELDSFFSCDTPENYAAALQLSHGRD
jgi:molybdopterin-guanine dinucleotide biosynthesis protein A